MFSVIRSLSKIARPLQMTLGVSRLPLGLSMATPQPVIVRHMASTRTRHKKILKLAKGMRGRSNRCYTIALPRVWKKLQRQYIGRKLKKRDFRKLWIMRINASARMYSMPYRHFVHGLSLGNVRLNRKVLAELATREPLSFRSVVEVAKEAKTAHGSWPLKPKKIYTTEKFPTLRDRMPPKKTEIPIKK